MNRKTFHAALAAAVTGAVLGLTARTASAVPLVFEDFNPAGNGGDLTAAPNNTVGTGLTGTWTSASNGFTGAGNAPGVFNRTGDNNDVAYPTNVNFAAPAGGKAQHDGGNYNDAAATATLATPISLTGNQTYYFSYLLHDYGNGNPNYDAQLFLGNATTRIYAGFGYSKSASISVTDAATLPFNAISAAGGSYTAGFSNGQLGLVLGALVTTPSGSDTIYTKIVPFANGGPANVPADVTTTYDAQYTQQLTGALTQLGVFAAGPNYEELDAIRIGTSYADVSGITAAPEPASLVLFGIGATGLLVRRRRPTATPLS